MSYGPKVQEKGGGCDMPLSCTLPAVPIQNRALNLCRIPGRTLFLVLGLRPRSGVGIVPTGYSVGKSRFRRTTEDQDDAMFIREGR
jgi:hypothetical protein